MPEEKTQKQIPAEGDTAAAPPAVDAAPQQPAFEPYEKASPRKRMIAWVGVVLMVLLVIFYTYSIASGNILKW